MAMDLGATQTRLDALLLRWEELHDRGQTLSPEQLAADTPELIPELACRIAALRAVDAMIAPPVAASGGTVPRPLDLGAVASPLDPSKEFRAVARMVEPSFHARGGLGEVLVARQEELGRDVALKRIRPDRLHDTARRRFLREAVITAGLQHPGIVPIYGLGQDDDGPFYTMPFIQGQTLDEAIRQFHHDETLRHASERRSLEFRGLLQRFIAVCETIAYAHDRAVVHRDLKPSNVMLGPYGETLVLDWGLAKRCPCDPADVQPEDEAPNSSPSPDDLTATGSVMGTPQYMSPEQAAGRPTGPASDIFSLGVILHAILTGGPPRRAGDVTGRDSTETGGGVSSMSPRVRKADRPRALEAIRAKSMAANPEQRYESARVLAEDLTKWLADQPVTAFAEPLRVRVRRWVRRHTRLVTGISAAMVVAAVALAVLTAVVSASNRRLGEANRNLVQARREAEAQRDQAQEVAEFMVSSLRKPDPEQEGSKVTVAEVLGRAIEDLGGRPKIAPTTRATILGAVGRTYLGLGLVSRAVEVSEQALSILRRELGEDHPDKLKAMVNLALAYKEAGQLDRAIPLNEQVLESLRIKSGEDHPGALSAMSNLTLAYTEAGQPHRAIPLGERALEARRAKLGEDHTDTLTTMNNLALAYKHAGQLDRAIPLFEQLLEMMRVKLGEQHLHTLGLMNNLASAYMAIGRLDRAIPLYQEVLKVLQPKLGEDHPKTLTTLNNLASAYRDAGEPERAIPLHEQALERVRVKLGADHLYAIKTSGNLAMDYHDAGRLDRALPLYEQTIRRLQAAGGEDRAETLALMNYLALAYESTGQVDRAIRLHEHVLEVRRVKLGEDDPDTLISRRNLARAYERSGRRRDAEALFRKVVEAARNQSRGDRVHASSLLAFARFLIHERRYLEAVSPLRECLAIKEKTQPDDWSTADARSLLGEALAEQGAHAEAEPLLLSAQRQLAERRGRIRPLDREPTLRDAVDRLIRLYRAWGKPAEAEAWRERLPTSAHSMSTGRE